MVPPKQRAPSSESIHVTNLRHSQHLLVDSLERIHALLKVDVVGWEFGLQSQHGQPLVPSLVAKQAQRRQEAINAHLVLSLTQLLLGVLEGA